ncbi:universal stress protein [Gordonia sp. NPDC003425]
MRYAEFITVGVDGSSTSLAAVRWATHTATIHHTGLDIVYAIDAVSPPLVTYAIPDAYFDGMRIHGREVLDEAQTVAATFDPSPPVRTHIIGDSPRGALLTRSKHASMLVVGASGTGRAGTILGSVPTALVAHSKCPVTVVREAAPGRPTSDVVAVGVDGSQDSLVALEWAADEAVARGARLDVIAAWDSSGFVEAGAAFAGVAEQIENTLADAVGKVRTRLPDLPVQSHVIDGSPVDALVKASDTADLMVLGHRGRGGFGGLLLGSTTRRVLNEAHCPLTVVH